MLFIVLLMCNFSFFTFSTGMHGDDLQLQRIVTVTHMLLHMSETTAFC